MKILLISDIPNWIITYNLNKLIEHIPEWDFNIVYNGYDLNSFKQDLNEYDIIHFMSHGELSRYIPILEKHKPNNIALTVRSHRYAPPTKDFAIYCKAVIGVNPMLAEEFNGDFIPNGVDLELFTPDRSFTVGNAGMQHEYKGVHLIQKACHDLGVQYKPASGNLSKTDMPAYYRSIDCYVCASIAEGMSTGVMEALAMNVPVVTTDVGVPKMFNIIKVYRNVQSIKEGIQRVYTRPIITQSFSWESVAKLQKEWWIDFVS